MNTIDRLHIIRAFLTGNPSEQLTREKELAVARQDFDEAIRLRDLGEIRDREHRALLGNRTREDCIGLLDEVLRELDHVPELDL